MFSSTTTRRLAQAASLTNTAPGHHGGRTLPERLEDAGQLATLLPDAGFDGPESDASLRAVRKLRAAVAGIWHDAAAEDLGAALEGINHLLFAAGPVRLTLPGEPDAGRTGAASPARGATGATATARGSASGSTSGTTARTPAVLAAGREGDAAEKDLSAALALALAEVALAGELTRLRTCSGEDCDNVFVDLTRNRSKQFCDEANCANRAHVRAYRARRAAEAGTAGETTDVTTADAVKADHEAGATRTESGQDAGGGTGKEGKKSARKAGKSGKKSGKKKAKKGGK